MKKKRKFFTLLEIIITLSLIIIISAYLVMGLNWLTPKKLKKEKLILVGDLLYIRELARCGMANYLITFDRINNQYSLYKNSVSPANLLEPPKVLKDGVVFIQAPSQVTYTAPKGNLPSGVRSVQIIELGRGNKRVRITIYPRSGAIQW